MARRRKYLLERAACSLEGRLFISHPGGRLRRASAACALRTVRKTGGVHPGRAQAALRRHSGWPARPPACAPDHLRKAPPRLFNTSATLAREPPRTRSLRSPQTSRGAVKQPRPARARRHRRYRCLGALTQAADLTAAAVAATPPARAARAAARAAAPPARAAAAHRLATRRPPPPPPPPPRSPPCHHYRRRRCRRHCTASARPGRGRRPAPPPAGEAAAAAELDAAVAATTAAAAEPRPPARAARACARAARSSRIELYRMIILRCLKGNCSDATPRLR